MFLFFWHHYGSTGSVVQRCFAVAFVRIRIVNTVTMVRKKTRPSRRPVREIRRTGSVRRMEMTAVDRKQYCLFVLEVTMLYAFSLLMSNTHIRRLIRRGKGTDWGSSRCQYRLRNCQREDDSRFFVHTFMPH